jgi:Mg2+ and Co2+ transporter CorA
MFDGAGRDRVVDPDDLEAHDLPSDCLLWIDVDLAGDTGRVEQTLERAGLASSAIAQVLRPGGRARVEDVGPHLHVEVMAVSAAPTTGGTSVMCVVGENLVVTAHRGPVEFLDDFRRSSAGGSELGALDAPSFLATLLIWQVGGFRAAVEDIVAAIDALEDDLLAGERPDETRLEQLVALRRRISHMRTLVAPHREAFERLAEPELDLVSSSASAAAFRSLASQVSGVVEAIENAREMLIGSFDILMARTGQRTNDVMKVLAVVSVTLLPSTLIAGLLGMNFHPSFFARAGMFWLVLGIVGLLISAALVSARRLRWF